MQVRLKRPLWLFYLAFLGAALSGAPARSQSLHNMVSSEQRVFPQVSGGIIAMQEDAAGHVYVLANPGHSVRIFDAKGNPTGEIPNANSGGVTLKYGIDLDVAANGTILVADRGANSVDIFGADGSLKKKVVVLLPTSIVALSNGQFAVTTLRTEHPVEIIDQTGKIVRGFGEDSNSDSSSSPPSDQSAGYTPPLADTGRLVGDSADNLYFAVLSTTDPRVRKFDRFGYAAYAASVPTPEELDHEATALDDRLQLSFNFTRLSRSDQISSYATLGQSGRMQFGGNVGLGLAGMMAASGRGGGRGGSSGTVAGTITANTSLEQPEFDMHVGVKASNRTTAGRGRGGTSNSGNGSQQGSSSGSASADSSSTNSSSDQVLEFAGAGTGGASDSTSSDTSATGGQYSNTLQFQSTSAAPTDSSNPIPSTMDYMFGTPQPGAGGGVGGFSSFFLGGFGPRAGGFGRPFPGGAIPGHMGADALAMGATPNPLGAATRPGVLPPILPPGGVQEKAMTNGPFKSGYGGRGGYGASDMTFAATLRINLDRPRPAIITEKTLTAVGVDHQTQEIWAAIGPMIIHFDKDGNPLDTYYLTTPEGAKLDITAIVVEPARLLIGSSTGGVYDFARPDKSLAATAKAVPTSPQAPKNPAQ